MSATLRTCMVVAMLAGLPACGGKSKPAPGDASPVDTVETSAGELKDSGPQDVPRRNDKASDLPLDVRTDAPADSGLDGEVPDSSSPPDVPDVPDIPDVGPEDLLDDEGLLGEAEAYAEVDGGTGDGDFVDAGQPEFPFEPCGEPGGNGLDTIPMCPVPAGTFWMGTPDGECDPWADLWGAEPCDMVEHSEQPFHEVYLAAFAIDQAEIRASQYKECIEAGVCSEPADIATPGGGGGGIRDGTGTVTGLIWIPADPIDPEWVLTLRAHLTAPPTGFDAIQEYSALTSPFPYEFTNVPVGQYYISGVLDVPPPIQDLEPGDEDFLGVYPEPVSPKPVTVVADQTTADIDFSLMSFEEFVQANLVNTLDLPAEDNYPINGTDWGQLKTYCEWAGKRLCTEAEWAKAAKGDTHRTWPWGNEWHVGWGNTYLPETEDGFNWVAPIGSYPQGSSPYGVLDMDANLMEFVQDWYGKSYYSQSPYEDPKGPCDGLSPCPAAGGERVLRGTSWNYAVASGFGADFDSRAAQRTPYPAAGGLYDDVGGRCCVTVE